MRISLSPADLLFLAAFVSAVALAAALRNRAGLLLALAAALGCAAYAVFVDMHTDEVTATLAVVAGGAFALGAAVPAHPWRWALIVGLAIPAKSFAALLARGESFDVRIFVTLLCAAAAAYAGAGIRRAASLATF